MISWATEMLTGQGWFHAIKSTQKLFTILLRNLIYVSRQSCLIRKRDYYWKQENRGCWSCKFSPIFDESFFLLMLQGFSKQHTHNYFYFKRKTSESNMVLVFSGIFIKRIWNQFKNSTWIYSLDVDTKSCFVYFNYIMKYAGKSYDQ